MVFLSSFEHLQHSVIRSYKAPKMLMTQNLSCSLDILFQEIFLFFFGNRSFEDRAPLSSTVTVSCLIFSPPDMCGLKLVIRSEIRVGLK
jgi:hypothetical protein